MPVYSNLVGEEYERWLALRLREQRMQRGWTLKQVAMRVSASISSLSAIENGHASPDLELIVRLTEAYGISLETLFTHGNARHYCISRREELNAHAPAPLKLVSRSRRAVTKYHNRLWPLADAFAGKYIEPFEIEIQPARDDELQFISHTHEEFVFVLRGSIEVLIKTSQRVVRQRLGPGDCMYFWSYLPHCIRSTRPEAGRSVHVLSSLNEPVDSETADGNSGPVIYMKEAQVKSSIQQVADRIISVRKARGMSAADLARSLGVNVRRLARIERGQGPISFKLLLHVCRALRKTPDYFLVTVGAPKVCHVVDRAAELRKRQQRDLAHSEKCLFKASAVALAASFDRKSMLPFLVTLNASRKRLGEMEHHRGQEFLYVLNGEVDLTTTENGQPTVLRLSPGDSCLLDASVPHCVAAASLSPYDSPRAQLLAVRYDSTKMRHH